MTTRNKGPTAIPVFKTRIPVGNAKEYVTTPDSSPSLPRNPCDRDIGQKVRVDNKEGTLRFIGCVHFAAGIWCGIELSGPFGKHDGNVLGIRYFSCANFCGLMAPLAKVFLVETADEISSGPHSILFGVDTKDLREKSKKRQLSVESNPSSTSSTKIIKNCTNPFLENYTSNFPDIVNSTRIIYKAEDTFDVQSFNENNPFIDPGFSNGTYSKPREGLNLFLPQYQSDQTRLIQSLFESNSSSSENTLESEILGIESSSSFANISTSPIRSKSHILSHSTPIQSEKEEEHSTRKHCKKTVIAIDEDTNKRDSLELDESLGILTPDQMTDIDNLVEDKNVQDLNSTLKEESNNIYLLTSTERQGAETIIFNPDVSAIESGNNDASLGAVDALQLKNPNVDGDQSVSLGIIELQSDATTNIMDLPLDSTRIYSTIAFEQTPSPEELPLDPTPVLNSDPKLESGQCKASNNYIISITSTTSLDTGYQGDGEMSRPGSRGADNSPMFKRPIQRRAIDPMTDSDFYTESDADIHDEQNLKGDRKAQIIDGTLYGVDAQTAADIYENNRENMDSSGIFTDLEANKVEDLEDCKIMMHTDLSPIGSDSSSKSISGNSQNNVLVVSGKESQGSEISGKRKSSGGSSTEAKSPNIVPRSESVKSFKMPKRNVTSKVKTMLNGDEKNCKNLTNNLKKIEVKKPVNKWDAVMSKISKSPNELPKVRDVKSKVFNNFNKENVRQNSNSNNGNIPSSANNKMRRMRPRVLENNPNPKFKKLESLHSSASDLSNGSSAKKINGPIKKKEVTRVNQVLTTTKLSPRSIHNNIHNEVKRTIPNYSNADVKNPPIRNNFSPKEKKLTVPIKDCGKATLKGGRTSPNVRPPIQPKPSFQSSPQAAEALAVLVQHLVFTLDAFQTPFFKKQIEKSRLEIEETKLNCRHLEEQLLDSNKNHAREIEDERVKYRAEITEILEKHRNIIAQLNQQHAQQIELLEVDYNEVNQQLVRSHEEQLQKLRSEFNKLQKAHEQTVEILREENDSTREEIDEKNSIIEKLQAYKVEADRLRKEFETKEFLYKEELRIAHEENEKLKSEISKNLYHSFEGKDNKFQAVVAEVESLRAVLEIKQSEIADLRKSLIDANQKAELLPAAEEKVSALTARCEDLQHQLKVKYVQEQQLITDNKKLQESFREEINHNRRLSQYNEELQWKLQQNKEVVTRVLEQAEETALNRSFLSGSVQNSKPQLERTFSFKEQSKSTSPGLKNFFEEDVSPPNSPKVKGVVEKSDSVSYVLEMEESPEIIANRIVRRSFRNATPPKTTPSKSPANKRSRMKNPLSMSSSATLVNECNSKQHGLSRSSSVKNGNLDNSGNSDDVFFWNNPACSTMNGDYTELTSLSVTYGEPLLRLESNSEDESSSSSSSSGHF